MTSPDRDGKIFVGRGDHDQFLALALANRHGLAARGEAKPELVKRAKDMGFDYEPEEFPVVFWDLFGQQGHPIRATVFEMGPLLVSRMLNLNDVQEGIINIAFRFADDDPEIKATDGE